MSMKYLNYAVTFQEVPNEVSLVLNITNCPHRCEGCHSPELRENIGRPVLDDFESLLDKHKDIITCVCFMGGDNDGVDGLLKCISICKRRGLKTCLYTGRANAWDTFILLELDYCKMGPYIEELGGLDSPTTNQRFYKRTNFADGKGYMIEDITSTFWRKKE